MLRPWRRCPLTRSRKSQRTSGSDNVSRSLVLRRVTKRLVQRKSWSTSKDGGLFRKAHGKYRLPSAWCLANILLHRSIVASPGGVREKNGTPPGCGDQTAVRPAWPWPRSAIAPWRAPRRPAGKPPSHLGPTSTAALSDSGEEAGASGGQRVPGIREAQQPGRIGMYRQRPWPSLQRSASGPGDRSPNAPRHRG